MNPLKSEPLSFQPKGNVKKYFSYREAWTRIKQAQEQGFYLETITIVESIISDRLISYLVHTNSIDFLEKSDKYPSFNSLIKCWKKSTAVEIDEACVELQEDVDNWRDLRNKIVHGMVKSHPDTETADIESFLELARLTAQKGESLARAVSSWCSKAKKKYQQPPGSNQ